VGEILGIARFKFHEGKVEEYKRLSAEAMEIVRTKDSGTEFRRDVIAVAPRRDASLAQIAKDFCADWIAARPGDSGRNLDRPRSDVQPDEPRSSRPRGHVRAARYDSRSTEQSQLSGRHVAVGSVLIRQRSRLGGPTSRHAAPLPRTVQGE
jgi:hypothetical protein